MSCAIFSLLLFLIYNFFAEVLKEMIAECKTGCSVRDLCILGDKKLVEETAKAYKKDKKIVKGEFRLRGLI